MADSYNKKERDKKRRKRKKDKAERKEKRKQEGNTTEEFMYVDENGHLTPTPPDPAKKQKFSIEDIDVSVPKQEKSTENQFEKEGIVKFFNTEKGYGFIIDRDTQESYFVHADSISGEITTNDKVVFEIGSGPKGPVANNVRKV